MPFSLSSYSTSSSSSISPKQRCDCCSRNAIDWFISPSNVFEIYHWPSLSGFSFNAACEQIEEEEERQESPLASKWTVEGSCVFQIYEWRMNQFVSDIRGLYWRLWWKRPNTGNLAHQDVTEGKCAGRSRACSVFYPWIDRSPRSDHFVIVYSLLCLVNVVLPWNTKGDDYSRVVKLLFYSTLFSSH